MPLNVAFRFSPSAGAPTDLRVRRYELREAMSELFELGIEVLSSDPRIDERALVGRRVAVDFGDEPFVPQIQGIIRGIEQRTAVVDGDSLYVLHVVPPVWLTTKRRDHRIFQNLSVPDIVAAVLGDRVYGGCVDAPARLLGEQHPVREYVVQYAETDWEFLSRILADEGIASFFDHGQGSAWTLVDDTRALAPDMIGGPIPFIEASKMVRDRAHVYAAVIRNEVETSRVTLRDYDFEKPRTLLEAKSAIAEGSASPNELSLEAYTFQVGKFTQQSPGDARAATHLEAARTVHRRILCTASFALPPGTRMTMTDHPRAELDAGFLVVRARTVVEGDERGRHELELTNLADRFRAPIVPKPRIHGTQTAFVVGAAGEEIDVDEYGRVTVEFRWDRRDTHAGGATRRVRVAQGWAGAGFGLVTLPRVDEEVIVAYLDGDPDEPIIIGRVHNALVVSPLALPAQKTVSVWRSKSTPRSDGYNQILLDDQAGAERFEVHAQRDLVQHVGHDAHQTVVGNQSAKVGGNGGTSVSGDKHLSVGGTLTVDAGAEIDVSAPAVNVTGKSTVHVTAGGERLDQSGNHIMRANAIYLHGDDVVQVVGPRFHVFCDEIVLKSGGAKITLKGGDIDIEASGTVNVHGSLIKLNS